jgi:hypothetical protein
MTTDHWMTLAALIISAVSLGLNFYVLRSKWMSMCPDCRWLARLLEILDPAPVSSLGQ